MKLTCTSEDMLPLAAACGFTAGRFKREYAGRLHRWAPSDRAHLAAELDTAYFLLYGLTPDDAEYMLSTFPGIHEPHAAAWRRERRADFHTVFVDRWYRRSR
ncbi:MAG: hypothetical protein U1E05_22870 [Patescibacteria group bacterium]|nr:hypothetical protein [Patescibacteria group bacterium]